MTVMTSKKERLLDYLMAIAGDPLIVQQALRELNAELPDAPDAEAVVRRIYKIKMDAARSGARVGAEAEVRV